VLAADELDADGPAVHADFYGANLHGAYLERADTDWPEGFDPEAAEVIFDD
jgi:hypothetical protein